MRLRTNCFKIYDDNGKMLEWLPHFSGLEDGQSKDFTAFVKLPNKTLQKVRICVKRKNKEHIDSTRKKLKRKESKNQCKIKEETYKFNEFIVLVTSLGDEISANDILETYRYRWQIETFFKRLKSIMDFGELPKKREKSSLAWLNGKLMVSLLMEILISSFVFPPREQSDEKHLS